MENQSGNQTRKEGKTSESGPHRVQMSTWRRTTGYFLEEIGMAIRVKTYVNVRDGTPTGPECLISHNLMNPNEYAWSNFDRIVMVEGDSGALELAETMVSLYVDKKKGVYDGELLRSKVDLKFIPMEFDPTEPDAKPRKIKIAKTKLMPIQERSNLEDMLDKCHAIFGLTGEKPKSRFQKENGLISNSITNLIKSNERVQNGTEKPEIGALFLNEDKELNVGHERPETSESARNAMQKLMLDVGKDYSKTPVWREGDMDALEQKTGMIRRVLPRSARMGINMMKNAHDLLVELGLDNWKPVLECDETVNDPDVDNVWYIGTQGAVFTQMRRKDTYIYYQGLYFGMMSYAD